MIKFFRTIRKNLLEEGNSTKYFKYAIGEIVLVVVGILIALSINNWNEHRKDSIKEKQIVKSLYIEFLENSKYIEERIQYLDDSYTKGSIPLMAMCNENSTDVSTDSLLTLIELAFIGPAYSPKVATFTRIINNEEFNLIQRDSLKSLLNQCSSLLNFTYISNNLLLNDDDVLYSYSNANFGGLAFGEKISSHQLSGYHLLKEVKIKDPNFYPNEIVSDPVFESILTRHILNYGFALNRLIQFKELIMNIRGYIDEHYSF